MKEMDPNGGTLEDRILSVLDMEARPWTASTVAAQIGEDCERVQATLGSLQRRGDVQAVVKGIVASAVYDLADVLRTEEGARLVVQVRKKLSRILTVPRTLGEVAARVAPPETLTYALNGHARDEGAFHRIQVAGDEPAFVFRQRHRGGISAVTAELPAYPGAATRAYLVQALTARLDMDSAEVLRSLDIMVGAGLLDVLRLTGRTQIYRWATTAAAASVHAPYLVDEAAEEELELIQAFGAESEAWTLADLRAQVPGHMELRGDRGPLCRLRRGGAIILMPCEEQKWYHLSQAGRQAADWLTEAREISGGLRMENRRGGA